MSWLPSFTFPHLPGFSSLPSISLPEQVQKRFISYLLHRSLGKLVTPESLNFDNIDAQISNGRIQLDVLDLDTQALSTYLPKEFPLKCTSGKLVNCVIQLPLPNVWTAPFSFSLSSLTIHLELDDPSHLPTTSLPDVSSLGLSSPDPLDVEQSVLDVSRDFVRTGLSSKEVRQLASPPAAPQGLAPFAQDAEAEARDLEEEEEEEEEDDESGFTAPGGFPAPRHSKSSSSSSSIDGALPTEAPSSMFAAIVEGLLARLKVDVGEVKVVLKHVQRCGSEEEEEEGESRRSRGERATQLGTETEVVYELRVSDLGYFTESNVVSQDGALTDTPTAITELTRVVKVKDISGWMLTPPSSSAYTSPITSTSTRNRRRSTSVSSTSSTASAATTPARRLSPRPSTPIRRQTNDSLNSDSTASPGRAKATSSDEDTDEDIDVDDMMMSRGIADLRESVVGFAEGTKVGEEEEKKIEGVENENGDGNAEEDDEEDDVFEDARSGESLYESAMEQADVEDTPAVEMESPFEDTAKTGSPIEEETPTKAHASPRPEPTFPPPALQPTATPEPDNPPAVRILWFGDEGLTCRFAQQRLGGTPHASSLVKLGRVSLALEPREVYALLKTGYTLSGSRAPAQEAKSSVKVKKTAASTATVELSLRSLDVKVYYTSRGEDSVRGDGNHLRLAVFGISAESHTSAGGQQARCSIADIKLNDHVVDTTPEAGKPPPIPVMAFNQALSEQYSFKEAEELPNENDADGWSYRVGVKVQGALANQAGLPKRASWSAGPRRRSSVAGVGQPAVMISTGASVSGGWSIGLQPIEVIADLSLVERLLPFLRNLPPRWDFSPPQPSPQPLQSLKIQEKRTPLTAECRMLRVALVGPPAKTEESSGRSGDVLVDLHDLTFSDSIEDGSPSAGADHLLALQVACSQVAVFHRPAGASVAQSVALIGSLPGQDDQPSIPLTVRFQSQSPDQAPYPAIAIPSAQIFLDRPAAEGLQYFTDDLAKWLDGHLHETDNSPRHDLKMIGSRFFSNAMFAETSTDSSGDEDVYGKVAEVTITDVRCRLSLSSDADRHRTLVILLSDLSVTAQNAPDIQGLGAAISAQRLRMLDKDIVGQRILVWTVPPSLATSPAPPCFLVSLSTKTGAVQQAKESTTKITLSGISALVGSDDEWPRLARQLLKPPKGVFDNVVPSDVSNIHLVSKNASLCLKGLEHGGVLVANVEEGAFRTRLVADAIETVHRLDLQSFRTHLIDATSPEQIVDLASGRVWKDTGFVEVIRCSNAHLAVKQNKAYESLQVEIIGGRAETFLAADSLETLLSLSGDIARSWIAVSTSGGKSAEASAAPPAPAVANRGSLSSTLATSNIFNSIDEDAFVAKTDMLSNLDLVDDDLPSHPGYLAGDSYTGRKKSGTGKASRASLPPEFQNVEEDDCKIEVLDATPFILHVDHYGNLESTGLDKRPLDRRAKLHLDISGLDLVLHLFDGYDWPATRTRIEAEIKAMRRNLIKLRQLLASGQTPQEPTGAHQSYLYNSIMIGLPEDTDFDDPDDALAAIDEELELLGNETASQTSTKHQAVADLAAAGRTTPRLGKSNRKLWRSSKHQVELLFKEVSLEMTSYEPGQAELQRVQFECGDVQIIDHIRTSTWKSFLTEWRSDRQGSLREAGARFLRAELVELMPTGSKDSESRLRIKVLPLRFHIDQDALSFLNRFMGFKSSVPISPVEHVPTAKDSPGRFFQHVEVYPVEVKLDYKPKRVNFNALTRGKMAELLNLFHFEGSKMVLRHVTLNGVSGWNNIYTKLCEVWAPDVTANQLSDVVAGVAPVRSVVNMGNGMADLILLPISHYKHTGKVSKGLKKGTSRFVKATASEALNFGLQIATGTQIILEKAQNALGAPFDEPMDVETLEDSVVLTREPGGKPFSRYANQPENVSQGFVAAYEALSKNLTSAAQTILAVPMEVYESSGDQSSARTVVRAVPIAMLKTMIGVTDASRQAMFGIKNEFRPGTKAEMEEKYKDSVRR